MHHANTQSAAENAIKLALAKGYDTLLEEQKVAWAKIWEMSDITIEGDVKAGIKKIVEDIKNIEGVVEFKLLPKAKETTPY